MKTDTELQQDVPAELGWQVSVHAAGIGVEVKDGAVLASSRPKPVERPVLNHTRGSVTRSLLGVVLMVCLVAQAGASR
ncbi:MAG: hypothetical protein ABI671_12825 [Burkholderiales bacterium]